MNSIPKHKYALGASRRELSNAGSCVALRGMTQHSGDIEGGTICPLPSQWCSAQTPVNAGLKCRAGIVNKWWAAGLFGQFQLGSRVVSGSTAISTGWRRLWAVRGSTQSLPQRPPTALHNLGAQFLWARKPPERGHSADWLSAGRFNWLKDHQEECLKENAFLWPTRRKRTNNQNSES